VDGRTYVRTEGRTFETHFIRSTQTSRPKMAMLVFVLTDTARFFFVRNAAGRTSVAFRLRESRLNGA